MRVAITQHRMVVVGLLARIHGVSAPYNVRDSPATTLVNSNSPKREQPKPCPQSQFTCQHQLKVSLIEPSMHFFIQWEPVHQPARGAMSRRVFLSNSNKVPLISLMKRSNKLINLWNEHTRTEHKRQQSLEDLYVRSTSIILDIERGQDIQWTWHSSKFWR